MLILLPCIVFAGNTDYYIRIGDQDAFVIGKIIDFKDNHYSVRIEKVLMGNIEGSDIKVEKPEQHDLPSYAIGHYFVISLDKHGTSYKVKYGAYMADSTDYRTLRLEHARPGTYVGRIQNFINSGMFIEVDRKAKEKKSKDKSSQSTINQDGPCKTHSAPTQSSLEWLYKDALKTILLPYVQETVSNYYGENTGYFPVVDLWTNTDIISIESPKAYTFLIKFEVSPYSGAHNSIGVDHITLRVSISGEVKVEKFEHIKSYPIPPWLQPME